MSSRLGFGEVQLFIIALAVTSCAGEPRALSEFVGVWSAEFSRRDHPSLPAGHQTHATIVFDSVVTTPYGLRLLGEYQLDSTSGEQHGDLVKALLGHEDPCLRVRGELMAYAAPGGVLEMDFSPGSGDCGLVGRLTPNAVAGLWHEPGFTGSRANGELRLLQRPKQL